MDFKPVTVVRDGVEFTCSESEEQLNLFLAAGYTVKEKPKTTRKKKEN